MKTTPFKKPRAEQLARLRMMGWSRKPTEYHQVDSTISGSDSVLTELPEFKASEVMDLEWNFLIEMPQYFVLRNPAGERFLVDTQGAQYPRYMQRVVEDFAVNG